MILTSINLPGRIRAKLTFILYLILAFFPAYSSAQIDVKYEGDIFPENNPQAFIRNEACDVRSVSTGVLNIVDTQDSAACTYYFRTDPLSPSDNAVFDFRMKVNSADSSYPPPNRAIAVGFVDGTKLLQVGFSEKSVAILGLDGVIVPGTEVPLVTNVYHDFRIVKNTNVSIQVYVDGVEVIKLDYAALPAAVRLNEYKQFFGAASMPGLSSSDWDYFRYTISSPNAQPTNDGSYQSGYDAGVKVCETAPARLAEQQAEIEKLKALVLELQVKNQASWTDGYQQGLMEGRQQCIGDPQGCQLMNEAQFQERLRSEVRQAMKEIVDSLPRGIMVSMCHRQASSPLCQFFDRNVSRHHKGRFKALK